MSGDEALRACIRDLCEMSDRALKAEQERDEARARAKRWKKLARELRRSLRMAQELNDLFRLERDEALSCLDEAQAEILRLNVRHTYMTVERDWYREACEEWLRHSHGCAADISDEYRCKCGLRKWLAEDRKRRETGRRRSVSSCSTGAR